jgi:uncharacterized membrane protein (UPF0127 family)
MISVAIVLVVLSAATYTILNTPTQANPSSVPAHFTANGRTFSITYVATKDPEWHQGLMDKNITDTTAMLFIFPNFAIYPFWMYHVNSSLDIIWLNVTRNVGRVVYLVSSAPGCSLALGCPNYTPSAVANYVIEAKGGFAETNGVSVGTTVQLG